MFSPIFFVKYAHDDEALNTRRYKLMLSDWIVGIFLLYLSQIPNRIC